MKLTRKQKESRQREAAAGRAADRAFDPIRAAIDSGELVITPADTVLDDLGDRLCINCHRFPCGCFR